MSKHFDAIAKDWDDDDFKHSMSTAIAKMMREHNTFNDTMDILDFGAGTGLLSQNFYEDVSSITAVDTSQAMLDQLQKKEDTQSKVTLCCQDIMDKPLTKKFDLIMSALAMHHVKDTKGLLLTLHSHLKPKGHLTIADLDSEDGSFHPASMEGIFHHGFDRKALTGILNEVGFTNVHFDTAFTITKEGKTFPVFVLSALKA